MLMDTYLNDLNEMQTEHWEELLHLFCPWRKIKWEIIKNGDASFCLTCCLREPDPRISQDDNEGLCVHGSQFHMAG